MLDGLSFSVTAGDFVAVIGPNGSGKTSLIRLILGLLAPSSGGLHLAPELCADRRRIGYVPQLKTLDRSFPAIALDLVVSGMRLSWAWRETPSEHEAALAALARVGAAGLAQRQLSVLSGGELQRVYLARALARRPRLLLLDEPASGIDVSGEADMYHLLEDYRRETGATVLMVTHDWAGALHHASRALLLNRRLLAYAAPETVLTDDNLRLVFGHSGHAHPMGGAQS